MRSTFYTLAALLAAEFAFASIQTSTVINSPNTQTKQDSKVDVKPGKFRRSLNALYMRDPEYEHAMNIIGKSNFRRSSPDNN